MKPRNLFRCLALCGAVVTLQTTAAQDYGSTLGGKPDPYRGVPAPPSYPGTGVPAPNPTPGVNQPWFPTGAAPAVNVQVGQQQPQPQYGRPQYGPQNGYGPSEYGQMQYQPGMQNQSQPAYQPPPPQPQPQPQFPIAGQANFIQHAPPIEQPAEKLSEFEPGRIVAVVGDQYILAGDIQPTVIQVLEPFYQKAKSAQEREAIEAQKEILAQQITRQLIDTKLMFLEFDRTVPKDKRAEVDKKVRGSFDKEFSEAREKLAACKKPDEVQELVRKDPMLMRLAVSMKEADIETLAELDTLLKKYGTSLERQTKAYGENRLGRSIVSKHINFNPEITFDEMTAYYQENGAEFDIPARAKFEALMIRKDRFAAPAEAHNALAQLGNEVFFGAPFDAVAKRSSQGLNAGDGGLHDWTQQGSLASDVVDQAIFQLPVGKLSQILEDPKAYYIIRVTERQEASRVPFLEAQDKIKEKIKSQKTNKQYKEFVEKLRSKTPVWCIYDKGENDLNPNEQAERQPGERQPRRR